MSDAYYLRSRGKVLGPFPLERLQVMKSRGQLGRTHQVSLDRQSWTAAGTLTELFPELIRESSFEPMEGQDDFAAAGVSERADVSASSGNAVPVAAWFYSVNDQQFGPTPATELRQLYAAGELSPNDMVWREGMESWIAIQDVPELRPRSTFSSGVSGLAGNASQRRRRSASSVTSLCLGLAPWCLYILGFLGMLLVEVAIRKQKPWEDGDILMLALGGGIYALFLGFAWFVMSSLAIVFGGVALAQISASDGRVFGQGMAVAGLVLGIANILLIFLWIPLRLALTAA